MHLIFTLNQNEHLNSNCNLSGSLQQLLFLNLYVHYFTLKSRITFLYQRRTDTSHTYIAFS